MATTTPTFAGFPPGITAGTYTLTLDLTLASSYNPAFITANGGTPASAEAVLAAGFANGTTYLNIPTTTFPGSEIRSFHTSGTAAANFFAPHHMEHFSLRNDSLSTARTSCVEQLRERNTTAPSTRENVRELVPLSSWARLSEA